MQNISTNFLHGVAICRLLWKVVHISTDFLHGVYQFFLHFFMIRSRAPCGNALEKSHGEALQ
jgi:hypothetical protein